MKRSTFLAGVGGGVLAPLALVEGAAASSNAVSDLIDQAIAELKLTTISGTQYFKKPGPGHWANALSYLDQAKQASQPAPVAGQSATRAMVAPVPAESAYTVENW